MLFPILHKVWHSILSMMKHIKTLIIDGSHYHLNSDFLLPIANVTVTVLLLRYTPPAASQTTHCHSYGYCWLWRYKSGCVIVICHVACIDLHVQTETQCRRRRTRGNGVGRQRAICMNGVARNKNILALDECTYRDDGLLQNTDCLLLNRRYCPGFWLVKPVVLERFYHANWPL